MASLFEERARLKAASVQLPYTPPSDTPETMAENLAASLYALIVDPPLPWADVSTEEQDAYRQFVIDLTAYVQRIA